ncbi:MAG: SURF1 family protein [Pseudomonadales bacterium]
MNPCSQRFRPGLRLTLFALVFVPVLCGLGFWQLSRGAEKQALAAEYLRQAGALPVRVTALASGDRSVEAFSRLRLEGRFDGERYYLIDNQVRDGEVGYWVVHWFVTLEGRAWLLNRGFVAAQQKREQWPAVETPQGLVEVVATVWPDTGLLPLLAPEPVTANWPKRRQRLNVVAMAAEREQGQALELRLEPGQPGVLAPAPLTIANAADRHRGYAVQWFGLAAVLSIGYLVFGLRVGAIAGSRHRLEPAEPK